ncbi:MAG: hypothetical protein RSD22_01405 [Romboutsia sp.]
MSDFNKLKDLYEDGYRCIYHNCVDSSYTIYLKNFNTEDSQVIQINNESDFSTFKDYLGELRMS